LRKKEESSFFQYCDLSFVLKENWKREFEIWTDKKPMVLTDSLKKQLAPFPRNGY
jgi:hypothetical protein